MIIGQGSRDADDDGVHVGKAGKIGGDGKLVSRPKLADGFGWNMFQVGLSGIDRLDLGRVDVEAGGIETVSDSGNGQRQANVSHADNANVGFGLFELFQ